MSATGWLAAEALTEQPCRGQPEPPLFAPAMLSAAALPLRALSSCLSASPAGPLADAAILLLCAGRTPLSGGWHSAEGVHLCTAPPSDGTPVRPTRQAERSAAGSDRSPHRVPFTVQEGKMQHLPQPFVRSNPM